MQTILAYLKYRNSLNSKQPLKINLHSKNFKIKQKVQRAIKVRKIEITLHTNNRLRV